MEMYLLPGLFLPLPDAGFRVWMGRASPLAQDHAGFQQARETTCVFGRGETVCAAHLPFLVPPKDSGLFIWPLFCIRL